MTPFGPHLPPISPLWVLNSRAGSLQMLYLAAVVGGIGMGCVFGTCMGAALKWFPDRRGLATGMIAAGLALGAAVTVIPVAAMIRSSGYRHTFLFFGLIQGTVIFVLGGFLIKPIVPKLWSEAQAKLGVRRAVDFTPSETVRTRCGNQTASPTVCPARTFIVQSAQPVGPSHASSGSDRK